MKYCGVCHSDLHHAANHNHKFGETKYPCVPGHELAGIVQAVGSKVSKVKIGDEVGVGCMVDSCLQCDQCMKGEEQWCTKKITGTYGSRDRHGRAATYPVGGHTLGGYSQYHVCDERFVIVVPKGYPLSHVGPVMCAGITMYDPLIRHLRANKGKRIAIAGLGGLGQMGSKLARALGCHVTVLSRNPSKENFAKGECNANAFVCTGPVYKKDMEKVHGTIDLILNTIPVTHDYAFYLPFLAPKGQQVILGLHDGIVAGFILGKLSGGKSRIKHSGIGGIRATQEVLDLCAKHDIKPEIEIRPCSDLNEIYERLDSCNSSGKRYVLDIEGTLNKEEEKKCTRRPPDLRSFISMSLCGGLCDALWLMFSCQAGVCGCCC
eukprot:g174.t1